MCGEQYDKHGNSKGGHICNVAISGGGNAIIDFSLEGLRDYLLEKGLIKNKKWLEEDVYP